uniref:Gag-Pol polyprotein n=1 Tax=Anthurium amnicola TaxID=1678845 RepID=A0A1D1YP00_9ARAE
MSSCGKSFHPDDLKKIQCYVCKGFGHFCCVDFIDTVPEEVSCYNCGDSGHSGAGCAKPRGESNGVASPKLCYICGEEGHFARGCTRKSKFCRRPSESSTLTPGSSKNRTAPRYSKNKKEFEGAKSLPRDFGMGSRSLPHCKVYNKKRSIQYERGINTTSRKSWGKGGWIVDDTGDLPKRNRELRPWKSPKNKPWKSPNTPRTPVQKSYRHYDSAGSSHRYHVY